MSSILKALKKVEKEKSNGSGDVPKPPVPGSGGPSGGRFGPAFKVVVALFLLAGLIAGGAYVYQERQPEKTAAVPAAPDPARRTRPAPAPRGPTPEAADPPKPAVAPKQLVSRRRERPAPASPPKKQRPAPERFEGPVVNTGSDGIPNPALFGSDDGDQDPADALKLQALAWSDDPDRRFAVINERIIKEGGRIGGMTVMEINPDQVILRQGGQDYTIEFTLK